MKKKSQFAGFNIRRAKQIDWAAKRAEMDKIFDSFKRLGRSTLNSSRVNAYRAGFESLFEGAKSGELVSLPLALRLLNSETEFTILKKIHEATKASKNINVWQDRLGPLISGCEFSSQESADSSARDFQFESYLGAVFELSGFDITFDEPDLVIKEGAIEFGVAAKRPRNKNSIQKNFKKAVKQIKKSGSKGFVALDLSYALYNDKCIHSQTEGNAIEILIDVSSSIVEEYDNFFRRSCESKEVMGVLINLLVPGMVHDKSPPRLATIVRWTFVPYSNDPAGMMLMGFHFPTKCEVGLFGRTDGQMPAKK